MYYLISSKSTTRVFHDIVWLAPFLIWVIRKIWKCGVSQKLCPNQRRNRLKKKKLTKYLILRKTWNRIFEVFRWTRQNWGCKKKVKSDFFKCFAEQLKIKAKKKKYNINFWNVSWTNEIIMMWNFRSSKKIWCSWLALENQLWWKNLRPSTFLHLVGRPSFSGLFSCILKERKIHGSFWLPL